MLPLLYSAQADAELRMKSSTRDCYAEKMAKIVAHIHEDLDDALDYAELARLVHMAPFHFHRVFRQVVGRPVQSYIRRLRLDRAAGHLATSDMKILDVAVAAQYQSNEAFTRAFKKAFGITPSDFREVVVGRQANGAPPAPQAAWRRGDREEERCESPTTRTA